MISFPADRVLLTDGVFLAKQKAMRDYLISFDLDRLMHTFRLNAGIPSSAEPLGGWESPSCLLRGHFVGHYLAAVAKMAFATGDAECRARALKTVDALEECAFENGYLSAFEEGWLDVLEKQENYGVWAPYYTLHKIINGLAVCGKYLDSKKAVAIATGLAHYIADRFDKLAPDKIDRILKCDRLNPVNEYGGIGDGLYSLWELTGDGRVLSLAKIFDRDYFVGELSRERDVLTDLHANTHLPQINSALHRYHITREEQFLNAGKNFYAYLLPRTFANGNSSSRAANFAPGGVSEKSEHWGGCVDETYLTGGESESCCAHNTEALLAWLLMYGDDKTEYLSHLELLKYNAVCNCASTKTGLSQYHQPMGTDVHKHFSSLYGDFWCCTGSGTEAMAFLSENIWFCDGDAILLNMFVPSRLRLNENGAELTLETSYPRKNEATLTLRSKDQFALTLRFRADAVCGAYVNGKRTELTADGGLVSLSGELDDGDEIRLELCSGFRRVPLGNGDVYAVMFGNVLLAKTEGEYGGEPLTLTDDGRFVGDECEFLPIYEVEDETYTVYFNSSVTREAKDGASAYN